MGMAHCIPCRDATGKTADEIVILISNFAEHTLELVAKFDMNVAVRFAIKSNWNR